VVVTPPVLIAFDVLYVKGRDVSQRPLRERRARLEDVVAGGDFVATGRQIAGETSETVTRTPPRLLGGHVDPPGTVRTPGACSATLSYLQHRVRVGHHPQERPVGLGLAERCET